MTRRTQYPQHLSSNEYLSSDTQDNPVVPEADGTPEQYLNEDAYLSGGGEPCNESESMDSPERYLNTDAYLSGDGEPCNTSESGGNPERYLNEDVYLSGGGEPTGADVRGRYEGYLNDDAYLSGDGAHHEESESGGDPEHYLNDDLYLSGTGEPIVPSSAGGAADKYLNEDEYLSGTGTPIEHQEADGYGYHNVSIYGNTYCYDGHPHEPDSPQVIVRDILYHSDAIVGRIRGRIYDTHMPKCAEIPCIVLQRVTERIDPVTLVRRTVMQVDAYADSHAFADEIAEDVLSVLTNATYDGNDLTIYRIAPESLTDLSIPETRLYRVTGDYAIVWRTKLW